VASSKTSNSIAVERKASRIGRRVVAGLYAVIVGGVVNLVAGAGAAWLYAHRFSVALGALLIAVVPEIVHEIVEAISRRRQASLLSLPAPPPRSGNPGPAELTALLRVAHSIVTARMSTPANARLRVTLFVPDVAEDRLYQVARWQWDDNPEISATTVQMGTCAAGHAWRTKEVYKLVVSSDLGFVRSLIKCGVSKKDAEAHKLTDRALFCGVPVFQDDADPAPYRRESVPPGEVIGVVVADAATIDCLKDDWHAELVAQVFPGLVLAMRECVSTKHLFPAAPLQPGTT
jgi:hypothetical protein